MGLHRSRQGVSSRVLAPLGVARRGAVSDCLALAPSVLSDPAHVAFFLGSSAHPVVHARLIFLDLPALGLTRLDVA